MHPDLEQRNTSVYRQLGSPKQPVVSSNTSASRRGSVDDACRDEPRNLGCALSIEGFLIGVRVFGIRCCRLSTGYVCNDERDVRGGRGWRLSDGRVAAGAAAPGVGPATGGESNSVCHEACELCGVAHHSSLMDIADGSSSAEIGRPAHSART